MKNLFKTIAFILVFLLIAIPLTSACVVGIGNIGELKACAREMYNLKEDTMDVLYIGSSSTWTGVSPLVVYNETGITGFNRSCTVQNSYTSYYYLLEALEYQSPEVLVLESHTMFMPYDEIFTRASVDSMKFSGVKNQLIDFHSDNSDNPLYTKASYYAPYLYYNSSWSELKIEEIYNYYSGIGSDYNRMCPMGNRINTNVYEFEWNEENYATTDEIAEADSVKEEYFVKIFELCKEKGIQVMVVNMPNSMSTYAQYNKMSQLCKEHDVMFYDLNLSLDELGIDPSRDFSDKGEHLNIYGNVKVSKHMAKLLDENFDLPDRRGTEGYEFYDKYLEKFLSRNGQYLE